VLSFLGEKPDDQTAAFLSCGLKCLDDLKAEDTIVFDIRGHSTVSDIILVTSGRSRRHVGVLAEKLIQALKHQGAKRIFVEGQETCNWVLIDIGSIIFHIFVPEVRTFYQLEKMWSEVSRATYNPMNNPSPPMNTPIAHFGVHEFLVAPPF
jgi:ribosome-associated protein